METADQIDNPDLNLNPPPEAPAAPALYRKSKLLLILTAILVLSAIAAAVFLLGRNSSKPATIPLITPTPLPRDSEGILRGTPTPGLTTDWKTYTNQLGFTIELPADWKIYAADISTKPNDPLWNFETNQLETINFHNESDDFNEYGNLSINLNIFANTQNLTTDSWAKSFFRPLGSDPKRNLASPAGQLTISGQPAKRFRVWDFTGNEIVTGLVYKNIVVEFSYKIEAGDPNYESKSQLYDQILSTFNFLDQIETFDYKKIWKTYTNTYYKYSLKYPFGWKVGAEQGANLEAWHAPYITSPCNYDSGDLCLRVEILRVQILADNSNNNLEPGFIVDPADKITNKISTTIDGKNASAFEYFQANYANTGRLLYVVVVNHGGSKFTFTYEESQKGKVFNTSSQWSNKKLFDQILSTFKFLD